ncbi:hypothetical protein CFOL_v3_29859 [Cephalotus follicularis]|uniref:Uncharacterized protein n=1 Tax=Cephalotus follicularis TaxID=3775 RepID=A0A1Q3D2A2_CEPFO|nr:hypothetical protein CFOL_v3_29859 [Cephalotus follicularis]
MHESRRRPFKFLNFWSSSQEFIPTVQKVWNETVSGNPLNRVHQKMRLLKSELKLFNNKFFNKPSSTVFHLREKMAILQTSLDANPSNSAARQDEKEVLEKLAHACSIEEMPYKQKSRVKWLKEGDSNTGYFHKMAALRRARNHITRIQSRSGGWLAG